jgi:hypothetical protein
MLPRLLCIGCTILSYVLLLHPWLGNICKGLEEAIVFSCGEGGLHEADYELPSAAHSDLPGQPQEVQGDLRPTHEAGFVKGDLHCHVHGQPCDASSDFWTGDR